VPDSLTPGSVEPLLSGGFGRPYLHAGACSPPPPLDPSMPEGAVAVCDEQPDGRGRLGRFDPLPPGTGVLCSTLLRPPAAGLPIELPLIGATAAADAVEEALDLTAQIKWPGDVMVNRRRVATVLGGRWDGAAVLEVAVNVNQTREQLRRAEPTSAASLFTVDGVRRDRAPILAALLGRLELHYWCWQAGGIDAVYDSLGARDFLRGRKVAVDGTSGYAVGIDRRGRLEIDSGGDRRLLESGDVTYER
jgi:BirA family biotin operon repressor/biotin-[acetyl-CoA-carboxylase] ligase